MNTRGIVCALVLLSALCTARDAETTKPNIVIILMDDMGYGDIGPFGSKLNRTPNLDRLASEGMKLTSYYAAPLCSASRAQMLTGCYAKRIGIPDVLFPVSSTGLSANEKTIAELLKPLGYTTMMIGRGLDVSRWQVVAAEMSQHGAHDLADLALSIAQEVEPTNAEVVWQRAKNLRQAKRNDEADQLMRRLADEKWPERYQGIRSHAQDQLKGR